MDGGPVYLCTVDTGANYPKIWSSINNNIDKLRYDKFISQLQTSKKCLYILFC